MCARYSAHVGFNLENIEEWLSDKELESANSFGIEKRKKQYCLGRITTKKALSLFTNEVIFKDISVVNEKSGYPIIKNSLYSTSITHADEIVASLVFKKEFSFGIDVQDIRARAIKIMKYITSDGEQIPNNPESLTMAWTMKESLSKALKCGFRIPFEELELVDLFQKENIFFCSYAKHREFKGIALVAGNSSFAITYQAEFEAFSQIFYKNILITCNDKMWLNYFSVT